MGRKLERSALERKQTCFLASMVEHGRLGNILISDLEHRAPMRHEGCADHDGVFKRTRHADPAQVHAYQFDDGNERRQQL